VSVESELHDLISRLLLRNDPMEVHGALIEELLRVSTICEPLISRLIVVEDQQQEEFEEREERLRIPVKDAGQESIF